VKYDDSRLEMAGFFYRNRLSKLLAVTRIGFLDFNGNGIQDPTELNLLQNLNVGEAEISGYELELKTALPWHSRFWAHYSKTTGTNTETNQPLSGIPSGYGAMGIVYSPSMAHSPWAELVWRHQQTQDRLNAADRALPAFANGVPGFDVVDIRSGFLFTQRVNVILSIENLFDEKYHEFGAPLYGTKRQAVITTQFMF
jgi:outer membrane receptor for ferrienterochelin and colicin